MKHTLMECLCVGFGGGLGALARHGLNEFIAKRLGLEAHLGTLAANVIGCLLIGMAWYLMDAGKFSSPKLRLLLITGFLGGLTTFSTFSHQSLSLLYERGYQGLLFNVGLNLILGIAAVLGGFTATSYLIPPTEKPPATAPTTSTVDIPDDTPFSTQYDQTKHQD